jgi:hypothetical protein
VPARRLLLIAALLLGLSVVVTSIERPELDQAAEEEPAPSPSAPETMGEAAQVPAPPGVRVEALSADERGQEVAVKVGRPLHLQITASRPGSVQIGEDGPIVAVQPEIPARVDLLPDSAGTRQIVLLETSRPIAELRVTR